MQDINPVQHGKSPLLALPPEIWSYICKLAVKYDEPINILAIMRKPYLRCTGEEQYRCSAEELKKHRSMLAQPAITRVCRAIRKECLPHFYKTNLFYSYSFVDSGQDYDLLYSMVNLPVEYAYYLDFWLEAIGPDNRAFIERLYYKLGMSTLYPTYMGPLDCLTSRKTIREEDISLLRDFGYGDEETGGWVVRMITAESFVSKDHRDELWDKEVQFLEQLGKEAKGEKGSDADDSDADDNDADDSDADGGYADNSDAN